MPLKIIKISYDPPWSPWSQVFGAHQFLARLGRRLRSLLLLGPRRQGRRRAGGLDGGLDGVCRAEADTVRPKWFEAEKNMERNIYIYGRVGDEKANSHWDWDL